MTLGMILDTMNPNKYVSVYWVDGEMVYNKVYEIQCRHKEFLDKEVRTIWAEEDRVCVYIFK